MHVSAYHRGACVAEAPGFRFYLVFAGFYGCIAPQGGVGWLDYLVLAGFYGSIVPQGGVGVTVLTIPYEGGGTM